VSLFVVLLTCVHFILISEKSFYQGQYIPQLGVHFVFQYFVLTVYLNADNTTAGYNIPIVPVDKG